LGQIHYDEDSQEGQDATEKPAVQAVVGAYSTASKEADVVQPYRLKEGRA
jgi:hypothetical protein